LSFFCCPGRRKEFFTFGFPVGEIGLLVVNDSPEIIVHANLKGSFYSIEGFKGKPGA